MPVLITSLAGAARTSGLPRRRLRPTVTVSGLSALVALPIPAGVTQIRVFAPFGLGGLFSVAPGTTEFFSFTRPAPAADENPRATVSFAAPGFRSTPIRIPFVRGAAPAPVPVTLATIGAVSAGTAAFTPLTYTLPVWAGDVSAREDHIWTSATEGGTYASSGELWAEIPNLVGTWWKLRSRAYGPTVADPNVPGWTGYEDTAPRQIVAMPAAATLGAGDVTIDRSVYRPTTQSTHFTPVVRFPGLSGATVDEIEFTADEIGAPSPVWGNVLPRPGEAGAHDLFDKLHPVAVPAADVALFQTGSPRLSRLRFRWRSRDEQPWSAEGAALTVPAVITTQPGANYTVANSTELLNAMVAATAGQVIAMQPGNYGSINRSNLTKSGAQVVIRPVDRANPPVFLNAQVTLAGLQGFVFDGITWRQTNRDANGYPPTGINAVRMDASANVTFRNCLFDGFHRGFYAVRSNNLTIEWCRQRRCGMDAFSLYLTHVDLAFRNNVIDDWLIDASRATGSGFHPDGVQGSTSASNNAILGWLRCAIEDNVFRGPLSYCQTIFLGNEGVRNSGTGSTAVNGHKEVTIRRNYIESRHVHGISIEGGVDFLIEGNLLRIAQPGQPNGPGAGGFPDIGVGGEGAVGIIRNNVKPVGSASTVFVFGDNTSLANVSLSGNVRSNTAVPPGWVMPLAGPYGYE